ncbi:MAG: type II secretion system protein [Lentisphaeraceae bacterium]|nr:type II secretion system protein [Lentisphaeraceae bacterium]
MKLNNHKNASSTKSLFTLIELLVVVAIIGILFSLLLPSIRKALMKAQQSVCLSNSKNLLWGTILYVNDHKQKFPPYIVKKKAWVTNWFGSMPTKPGLRLAADQRPVNPYLVSELKPDTKVDVANCSSKASQNNFAVHGTTYSANQGKNSGSLRSVKTMDKINEPSRYVIISEYPTYSLLLKSYKGSKIFYHNNFQYSICFTDGSAEGNLSVLPYQTFTEQYTFNNNK